MFRCIGCLCLLPSLSPTQLKLNLFFLWVERTWISTRFTHHWDTSLDALGQALVRMVKKMLSNFLEEIMIKYEQPAWPHRHPVFWSVITASSSTTPIWNKNLERRKPEQFLRDLEFQSLIQLTMGLPHKSVQLDPDRSHKRMWDFLIKIRNLCPQQTNIPWVGCLCILPLTAWQSTKAVPFLKLITDAAAENMSASSKAS